MIEPTSIVDALALLRRHFGAHADPLVRTAAARVFCPFTAAAALDWAPGEVARPFGFNNGWLPIAWRGPNPLVLAAAIAANPRLAAAAARANTVAALHALHAADAPLDVVCALRRVGDALCPLVYADEQHAIADDADVRWGVVDPDDQPPTSWSIMPSLWSRIAQVSGAHNRMLSKPEHILPIVLFEKALPNEAPGRKSTVFYRALVNEPAYRAVIACLYVYLMGGLPSAAREPYCLATQTRIWASFALSRDEWYALLQTDGCPLLVVAAWRSLLVDMIDHMPNMRELYEVYYDWTTFAAHTRSDAYDVRTLTTTHPMNELAAAAIGMLRGRHARLNDTIRRRSLKTRLMSLPSLIGTYVADLQAHRKIAAVADISPGFAARAAAVAMRHSVGLTVGALDEMGLSPRGRAVARMLCELWNEGATLKAAHIGSFPPVDRQAAHALFVAIARRDRFAVYALGAAVRDAQLAAVARRLGRGTPAAPSATVPAAAAVVHVCSGTCAAPAFAAPAKARDCSANGPINVVVGIDDVAVCGQRHGRVRCNAPLVPMPMLGTAVLINHTLYALCVGCGLLARIQLYDAEPRCPICAKAAAPPMPAIAAADAHRPSRRRRRLGAL